MVLPALLVDGAEIQSENRRSWNGEDLRGSADLRFDQAPQVLISSRLCVFAWSMVRYHRKLANRNL